MDESAFKHRGVRAMAGSISVRKSADAGQQESGGCAGAGARALAVSWLSGAEAIWACLPRRVARR